MPKHLASVVMFVVILGFLVIVGVLSSGSRSVSAAGDQQVTLGGDQSPTVKSFNKTDVSVNGYALYLLHLDIPAQPDKTCVVWVKEGDSPPPDTAC